MLFTLGIALNRDVLYEFHLKFWNTASIGIPVRRLLTGLTAHQKGTTARWYSHKTSLSYYLLHIHVADRSEAVVLPKIIIYTSTL